VSIEVVPFKDGMPEYFFLVLFRDFFIAEADDGKSGGRRPTGTANPRRRNSGFPWKAH